MGKKRTLEGIHAVMVPRVDRRIHTPRPDGRGYRVREEFIPGVVVTVDQALLDVYEQKYHPERWRERQGSAA